MKKYYYPIGEVSNIVDVPKPTLRHWEKEFNKCLGSIRKSGGNRRYTHKQLEIFKKIKNYLYTEKYTIEGAKRQFKLKGKKQEDKENIYRKNLIEIKKLLEEEI